MPTLHWIGKERVVNHHQDVPFRVLEHVYGFRSGDAEDRSETGSGNKIIHGDNLEALKALLPEYEGRVKCIYIDPPYNTGNEKWVYNDNVNDPRIKKWLGEVVGKQGEDLSRHANYPTKNQTPHAHCITVHNCRAQRPMPQAHISQTT
ncbi:MAG: hypothetical protein SNH27_17455, partial [Rikenellaceae bacterium]